MACETWASLIVDRITDELDEEASISLEQHLAECRACEEEEGRIRRLLGAAAPREEWRPAASVETRLGAELRRLHESPAPGPRARSAPSDWLRGLFRLRIPAYAVPLVAATAIVLGIWIGGAASPGDSMETRGMPLASPRETPSADSPFERPADRWNESPRGVRPQDSGESFASMPEDLLGRNRFLTTPADGVLGAEAIYADSL